MAENEDRVIVKEVRSRNDAELQSLLASKADDLHKAKFKHALGQLQNTHELKALKKDVARLNTLLNERAVAAGAEAKG